MMKAFQRILVGMDLTQTDYRLLEYVRMLAQQTRPEKVYFIHISPDLSPPEFAPDLFGKFDRKPMDEQFREEMKREVNRKITPGIIDAEFIVVEGSVTDQLIHWSDIKQVDLVILGKKAAALGSGIAAKRFLRRTKATVLFVPEASSLRIEKILVPTDFSDDSRLALQQAIELAGRISPQPKILVQHVFHVPTGVHAQLSRSQEEFTDMILINAQEYYEEWLEEVDLKGMDLAMAFEENILFNPARHIVEKAQNSEADLLIIGAKGHTAFTAFILGSVTEKVQALNEDIPLMVVRPIQQHEPVKSHKGNREDLLSAI
ncbi:MAG: universal stress protein [Bacteroidota bacterium]